MRAIALCILLFVMSTSQLAANPRLDPNATFLPEQFPIYVKDTIMLNFPERGFTKKLIPTVNHFKGVPGCYIACYSEDQGVYLVSPTIYLHGMIRVDGHYKAYTCVPKGLKSQDVSKDVHLKTLCQQQIGSCKLGSGCWAGGDTEGWFNLQPPTLQPKS